MSSSFEFSPTNHFLDAISKAITDSRASEAQNSVKIDTLHPEDAPEVEESAKLYDLDFLVDFPSLSALDLDIIKLTAQFAAKNGKQFILHLAQKESRNSQFDFLKPHHNLHHFYQTLAKQYSLVFSPTENMMERVKRCANQKNEQLSFITHRARIEKLDREKADKELGLEEAERGAFTKINWHDFVVAETVIFAPEDKNLDLPCPINVEGLKAMPITQKLELWTGRKIELNPLTVADAAVALSHDQYEEEEMEIEDNIQLVSSVAPITLPSKRPNEVIMGAAFGGASVKVRTDYVPRGSTTSTASGTKLSGDEACQVCSICKASVPVSQIEEHIRIELLDPKWRQQRMAMLAKNRDSNVLETGTDVSHNLEQLARNRTDIFGNTASTGGSSSETIERGPTRPIWDGHADSIAQINRTAQMMAKPQIEQEMAALQRSGDYSLDPSKGIGPRAPQAPSRPYFMHPMTAMMPGVPFPSGLPFPPGSMPPGMSFPTPGSMPPGMSFPPPGAPFRPGMPLPPPGIPFPPPFPPGSMPPGMPYFPGTPFPQPPSSQQFSPQQPKELNQQEKKQ